jgi:hypothetical protein
MGRWIVRSLMGLLIAAAMLYMGDWAVWKMRVAHGGGTGSVQVTRMVVATLKGNKEEYYPQDTETVSCSVSIFPWTSDGACWWVRGHPIVMDRY